MKEFFMNIIFDRDLILTDLKELVQNDYNSTKIKFTMDKQGRKVFKMLFPSGEEYIDDIVNDEIILGEGILAESGKYKVEISVYNSNSKLTNVAICEFFVRPSLVPGDEEITPDERIPILDNLINEVENLNIDVNKVGHTTTVTLTKKDGTQQEVEILDGENGTAGQDAKINGYNTLNIVAGDNITIEQEEDTLTISSEGGSGGGNVDDVLVNGESVVTDKIANVVVPTKTSDLTNDSNFVEDANYVHTDNNFTTAEKTKLSGLSNYDDTEVKQDIEDLGIEIDNLDLNKVPKTRKINNKTLENDITLTPSDIGLGSVFTLKGSVATTENLPSTGNVVGDVYYVESEEVGYIWLEKQSVLQWEQLGLPIDLSNYYNKTQTDNLLVGKQDTLIAGDNITIAENTISAVVLEPIIINATNNTTINGYQVPLLTSANIQAIYNGIVAGREVVVTDATENMHFKVNQADTVSDEIFISYVYFDVMLLQYDENGNITYKELASKNDIAEAIGNAIEGSY